MPLRYKGLILTFFLLFLPCQAFGAPTYGTDMPKRGQITMGYQSNFIFKHDLSDSYGNIKSNQIFFDLSWGVYDWFSFDGKIGTGDLLQKGGIHPKVCYDYGLAGGYGFRILVLDDIKNRIRVVAGFHHVSVHPHNRNIDGNKYESLLDDWQFDVLSSRDFDILNPFLGIKVSRCDLVYKVNEIDRKRRSPLYYVGLILGCTIKLLKDISLSVESHFIDESSLSAGVYWTF